MTIAFVFEIFYPVINGIITASHNLAQNLMAHGHRVIYLAPEWEKSTLTEVEGIPVFYVPSVDSFAYPGMRMVLPWSRRVKIILEQEEVDVVHATGPWLLNYAALRAANRLQIGSVQTFHTMLQEREYVRYFTHTTLLVPLVQMIAWHYFKLYMRRSDAITAPSHYVSRVLQSHYPNSPVYHIPNGIDINKFGHGGSFEEICRRYPMYNEKTFIFIGRLGEEKSVKFLIDAFYIAAQKDSELRLLLIGDGPSREDYKRQVKKLHLSKTVFFLGRLSPQELHTSGLMQNACGNVTASTTESFGMTIVEAMAAKTPSIVPDVPGVAEITERTGLIFHKQDMHDLADKILLLAHDKELRRTLSEECARHSKFFEGSSIAQQFEELYEMVLQQKGYTSTAE